MTCPFCEDPVPIPQWSKSLRKHFVATIDNHKHLHIHGDIDDKGFIKEVLLKTAQMLEVGVKVLSPEQLLSMTTPTEPLPPQEPVVGAEPESSTPAEPLQSE